MSGLLNININDQNHTDSIKGVKVLITEHNNRDKVIRTVTTDNFGQANNIELSSSENRYSGSPYKKYDLVIQVPPIPGRYDYQQEYIKSGVQIWDGKVTVNQDELVQINQLKNITGESRGDVIEIPENSIVRPEESNYQDPLGIPDPDPYNPNWIWSFETEPFIPTEVSIYLGYANPYATAQRIDANKILKESYKKYLKIVSSQEFGGIPKLSEQAAIANILLINSFALNRVYTEIYRNKGYDFTITNSTSFDQHYPPGGTIFQNLEGLVDEHFRKYIKIQGKKQPLLAQYCAGSGGSCSNKGVPQIAMNKLSLSNPNLSYEELLLHYYDLQRIEIEIVTAEIVEGNPKSYPGYPLQIGMKEDSIKTLQEFLRLIREEKYTIEFPTVEVTGEFDEKTREAVIVYQNKFEKNKKNKGIVDEATWYKLSLDYMNITKMNEPNSRFMKAFMY
ncbi:peptidoglycan-binding protein [Paenibacillus lautus]|uniref:peptidoglycan-binding domain-containing protein n=1 Tax=Paenibacillus lautus TaxID=1401 RepID=UPI00203AE45C|nr:peptidoglycan-binding domain-containing protein [Paenibacillus lautus]MCM3257018.1 peptidoglycan-binding protein [Paenibacillus lautus]